VFPFHSLRSPSTAHSPLALWRFAALSLLLVAFVGCDSTRGGGSSGDDDDSSLGDDDVDPVSFRMWSTAFEDGDLLPEDYECYQSNPAILWEGVPEGTEALALIFDDPTAGNFPHWAIYNIPPSATGLDEGISGQGVTNSPPAGASELENGFTYDGYLGSCPCSPTPNTYRWRLWALSEELPDPGPGNASAQFNELADAAEDASIEELEMSHRYGPATLCR